MNSYVLGTYM